MKIASCLAVVLLVSPCFADSIDDAEAKKRGVPVELIQKEKELEQAQRKIAELEKQVVSLNNQVASLRLATQPKPTPSNAVLSGDIVTGKAGVIPRIIVEQVIDKNNALVTISPDTMVAYGGDVIVKSDFVPTKVYLSGFSTEGWTDGAVISFNKQVKISGTKTYATASGSQRTLFLVIPNP